MESDSSLKIVLGGSSLAVLTFDFILMQEENISPKRFPMTNIFNSKEIKKKGHYTIKNTPKNKYSDRENTSDSDGHNTDDEDMNLHNNVLPRDEEVVYNPNKSLALPIHPLSEAIQSRLFQKVGDIKINKETDEIKNKSKHSVFQQHTNPSSRLQHMSERHSLIMQEVQEQFQTTEPRAIKKRIEEMIDNLEQRIGIQPSNKNNEDYELVQEKDILKKWHTDDNCKEKIMMKNEEQNYLETIKEERSSEITRSIPVDEVTVKSQLPSKNDCTNVKNAENSHKEKMEKIDKGTKSTKEKAKIEKQKNKSYKKKSQNKQKKCTVM